MALVSWRFAGATSIAKGMPYFSTASWILTPRTFLPPSTPRSKQLGAERQERLSMTTTLGSGVSPQARRQVRRRVAGFRRRSPAPSEPDGTIARHPAQASAALCAARKIRLRLRHAFPFVVTPVGPFDAKHRLTSPPAVAAPLVRFRPVASLPPRPVGSQPPFGLGISRSRRPYLPRYKTAFAFSDSPLPPPSSPFLAVGIPPRGGTSGAYPVVQCGDADGEAASCSPAGHGATVVDGYNRRTDPHAILAPACQHLWPVLDDGP